jgi:flagellar assembly factor FliW
VTVVKEDMKPLGIESESEAEILCTVTARSASAVFSANLRAPLVIHGKTGLARQVVLMESHYHTRHDIARERMETSGGEGGTGEGNVLQFRKSRA